MIFDNDFAKLNEELKGMSRTRYVLSDRDLRYVSAMQYLGKLGYYPHIFDGDSRAKQNEYYDVKEYDKVAADIADLFVENKEIPGEKIEYMLRIKAINESINS